jgi:exo-1,4-beta-D-glucosaminidase
MRTLHSLFFSLALFASVLPLNAQATAESGSHAGVPLTDWAIQSSSQVKETGEALSTTSFHPNNWHPATVPTTVVAALVRDKVYPDPFFGMNLRSIPGTTYPIGKNFSNLSMPRDSPFAAPWWFRTEFRLPAAYKGKTIWLHFDGINYRANLWLNGRKVADAKDVAGTFRSFEFNVSSLVRGDMTNVLAVEVFAPEKNDLAITWVDWNPAPPDKNMGLWKDVYLFASGDASLRHTFVKSKLDSNHQTAALTISAGLQNSSDHSISGILSAEVEGIHVSQPVELGPSETRAIVFDPEKYPSLKLMNPRLWWPYELGAPNLYAAKLTFSIDGQVSASANVQFGIREIESQPTDQGHLLFKINGRRILIRGGGWAPDMLLRASPDRLEAEFRYVRDMNLNTIRLEGKLETDEFFDLADRSGILIMAGWCCCDHWEQWSKWSQQDHVIARESLRDQILRLRVHPSLLVWLNGSDAAPPPDVERAYLGILGELGWPNPVLSTAEHLSTKVTGPSRVKEGIYQYVPPSFWLLAANAAIQQEARTFENTRAGAFGFTTETSPGPAIPPVESLRQMLPPDHLWPVDEYWNFHAGGAEFRTLDPFTRALNRRYAAARNLEEYVAKAQLMAYEGQRAMFEAYGRNKYNSTGVIQWMLNNAWPSVIWHLYDYYLRPGAGYFGTKKACEPLHVQYSYDDHSVAVINGSSLPLHNYQVSATVWNVAMKQEFTRTVNLDLPEDSSSKALDLPEIPGLTTTYFLRLTLQDPAGKLVSSNFYWLSTKPDIPDWPRITFFGAPMVQYGDLTALSTLPKVRLKYSSRTEHAGLEMVTHVTVENPGENLAFFIRLKVSKGPAGEEVLPVLWQDNYFSLLPGEKREITATYRARDLGDAQPEVSVDGWNVIQ